MEKIGIRPIGNIEPWILDELSRRLGGVFGCPVEIMEKHDLPDRAYDPKRRQYHSTPLLATIKGAGPREGRVLGVVDVDLYVRGLNFVFGEADPGSKTALISLCRLRQEYYGLPPDEPLFAERATKEAIHELGHTYGLRHCRDERCIMYFSSSLLDTDRKRAAFCNNCSRRIKG